MESRLAGQPCTFKPRRKAAKLRKQETDAREAKVRADEAVRVVTFSFLCPLLEK
eukprot:SAG31_NODE_31970_length_361_cov_1.755725_2_plen_53_part_01